MTNQNRAENETLVFDWGDTLLKVFPQYAGPMASWPEVETIEGVKAVLDGLQGRYQMVVATNASDSGTPQVQQALDRAGLGGYFQAIFTSKELGWRKPDLPFFRGIEQALNRPPQDIIMIGDSYLVDMLGAKVAGWRTLWYNPSSQAAPGAIPLHDNEIQAMAEVLQAIRSKPLPDYQVCLAWMSSRNVPFNLLSHVQIVASAAYLLAVWLRQSGERVDPILTHRGGLLHDLAKMDSVRRNADGSNAEVIDHAAQAAELLLSYQQDELAEIASRHMPYQHRDDPRRPITWEQKLVHYADKLSEGAQLVSLDQRFQALKGRYPQYANQIEASRPVIAELQQEICDHLETSPEDLLANLQKELGQQITVRRAS